MDVNSSIFVRLALGRAVSGHPIDVNCFKAWMNIVSNDMFNIYEKNIFIDYLPGYLIVLALFKTLFQLFHILFQKNYLSNYRTL